MADAIAAASSASPPATKRKRDKEPVVIAQFSARKPVWAYLHIRRISSTKNSLTLDEMTVSLLLDAATSQFLGLHGKAIPIDILKVKDQDVWLRIPNQDQQALVAALSAWSGRDGDMLRVMGWSSWDANAYSRDAGQDLFED